MLAVVVAKHGGPEVLEVRDEPDPQVAAGEVLVEVDAAGVNYRDIYEREGSEGPEAPFIAGIEGAGRVSAAAAGVIGFAPGDRVAWTGVQGSYATRVSVPSARAVLVPDAVSSEIAAAALLQGITAHFLAKSTHDVQPGETALVHAVAGGVGLLLTQVIKLRGGRVIGTASSPQKAELARRMGADEVIGYDRFAERVRELTGGQGATVVYDGIGRATFDESLASLRSRGSMVLYGSASGRVPPFDPMRLDEAGSLSLTRPSIRDYTADRAELEWRAGELFGWIAEGAVTVRIAGRYRLEQAGQAQQELAARRTSGKLILLPAGSTA
jgi:NADPH:quinone reductase